MAVFFVTMKAPHNGISNETKDVFIDMNCVATIEDMPGVIYGGEPVCLITMKDATERKVIGSVKEIARKIETEKSRFVVDLTTPKSE
jgi:hypothetical protein